MQDLISTTESPSPCSAWTGATTQRLGRLQSLELGVEEANLGPGKNHHHSSQSKMRELKSLCCAFPGNCLQRLDLSDNPMTGEVAESLAAMLKGQPHLRALNLNDTSLEDEGVSTIAQALTDAGDCSLQLNHKNSHEKLTLHI